MSRPRLVAAACFVALIILFLIANRGAYKSYFQDDELDNISWTPYTPLAIYAREAVSPLLSAVNFRPVGHLYFRILAGVAGLKFPWYVAGVHLLHFVNVLLFYMLIRRLDTDRFTAGAATAFFAFHVAVFDVYWKPMYVFDVLCALFCLLSLHAWIRRRWVLSFVCFWLAYKSKEVAVMLPAALVCYEYWLGERKWKPLIPFFAASLVVGIQGVFFSPHINDPYTLHFTPAGMWRALSFYMSRILLVPYAGFALLALPLAVRQKRVWFGTATAALMLMPMLALTSRTYAAYLYVPLVGLALAIPPLESRRARIAAVALFLLWIPFNYNRLRAERRVTLDTAGENRAYVDAIAQAVKGDPTARTFILDGAPTNMNRWGTEGAIRYFNGSGQLDIRWVEDRDHVQAFTAERFAMLIWDRRQRRMRVVRRRTESSSDSYVDMTAAVPVWQLTEGWYDNEETYRWIRPRATARLHRPASARSFELVVNAGPTLIADVGKSSVEVYIGGRMVGRADFTKPGLQTVTFPLENGPEGAVDIEFRVAPPYHPQGDPRVLGIAIASFGFR